jgi:hypothetical protein
MSDSFLPLLWPPALTRERNQKKLQDKTQDWEQIGEWVPPGRLASSAMTLGPQLSMGITTVQ